MPRRVHRGGRCETIGRERGHPPPGSAGYCAEFWYSYTADCTAVALTKKPRDVENLREERVARRQPAPRKLGADADADAVRHDRCRGRRQTVVRNPDEATLRAKVHAVVVPVDSERLTQFPRSIAEAR